MPLKQILGFLSICTLLLLFPSKNFAVQCVTAQYFFYINCDDDICSGFKEFTPFCGLINKAENLPLHESLEIETYLKETLEIETLNGFWKLHIAFDCYPQQEKTNSDTPPLVIGVCGANQSEEIVFLSLMGQKTNYSQFKAEVEDRISLAKTQRDTRIFVEFILFLALGSTPFIILIIKYIINQKFGLRVAIAFWGILQIGIIFVTIQV